MTIKRNGHIVGRYTLTKQGIKYWWGKRHKKIKAVLFLNVIVYGFGFFVFSSTDFSFLSADAKETVIEKVVYPEFEKMPQEIKDTLNFYADLYGVDRKLVHKIVSCESNYEPERIGFEPNVPLNSVGLWQFQPGTFAEFSAKYKIRNANIYDWRSQTLVAMQMLRDGKAFHWTCYQIIKGRD